jgi:group I intron endonuclease
MTCGIYKITNSQTGRIYYGASKNIEARWGFHLLDLEYGQHHSVLMQLDYEEYGFAKFKFEIIEEVIESRLSTVEKTYLKKLKELKRTEHYNKTGALKRHVKFSKEDINGAMSRVVKTHRDPMTEELSVKQRSRRVCVRGVDYDSVEEASKAESLSVHQISGRCGSDKYPTTYWIDPK